MENQTVTTIHADDSPNADVISPICGSSTSESTFVYYTEFDRFELGKNQIKCSICTAHLTKITDAKNKFIELDRKRAEIKQFFDDYKAAVENVVAELGSGVYFQDDEGVVYKTSELEGKFVYFDKFEIKHTRREGEEKGTLSITDAQNAGFTPANAERRAKGAKNEK